MKKILKYIGAIFCIIIGIVCLHDIYSTLQVDDPWGLSFVCYILPLGLFSFLLFAEAYILIKDLRENSKKEREQKI